MARFEGFAKQSHISAHRECLAVSGANGGFMLVERELTELTRIMTEEETLALNAKAAAIVQDFEIQLYGGGSEQVVQQLMGNYAAGLQELGYL